MPIEIEVHTVPHLKLYSIPKWRSEGSSMLALLGSKIALSNWDV